MKVSPRLHSPMSIPGNGVDHSRGNQNHADRTDPALALFGIAAGRLGYLKFNASFDFNVRDARAKTSDI